MQVDKSEVRITDSSGHIVYRGEEDVGEFLGTGAAKSAAYQKLALPGSLYEKFKDRPLRLEFDYSMTLLRVSSTYAVPAPHGDLRKPGLGICATETS